MIKKIFSIFKKKSVEIQVSIQDWKKVYKNHTRASLIREIVFHKIIIQTLCDTHNIDPARLKDYFPKIGKENETK